MPDGNAPDRDAEAATTMAAGSPRLATALLVALVFVRAAPPARAAEGTVVVGAGITPRLALFVENADPTGVVEFASAAFVPAGQGLPLGAIDVRVESNTAWDGFVSVEVGDPARLLTADVPLVSLVPVGSADPDTDRAIDVGTGPVRWASGGTAGRSIARYGVELLAQNGPLRLPVELVFVVRADGGEMTAEARIAAEQVPAAVGGDA
ncbi:MAG TPA: hypothetical protein VH482_20010 [Thermomicrobiales bacterium]|jgi:FlaG/FlaF family flagellin (archaellin)